MKNVLMLIFTALLRGVIHLFEKESPRLLFIESKKYIDDYA